MTTCTCTDHPQLTTQCICTGAADNVLALKAVREAFLSPRNARQFLHTYSPRLGGVPMRLLLDGRHDEVVQEARRAAA